MRSYWCILVMVSALFTSADGAADMMMKGHPHNNGDAHQSERIELPNADQTGGTELDVDHCEQCCDGHSVSIGATGALITAPFVVSDYRLGRSAQFRNFAQAPPTPPPNA